MKTIFYTAALLAACLGTSVAQTTSPSDSSRSDRRDNRDNRPLIDQRTKDDVREKAQDVKQDVREKSQDLKEDVNEATSKAKTRIREEYEVSRSYQERNQLTWFQKGSVMASASLGFGTGSGSGTYLAFAPRAGYFFNTGLMAGLQFSFDSRLSTSYKASQGGVFLRYYPWRTRISGFGGVGYNFGSEQSSNIGSDAKANYQSVNLEIGTMLWIRRNLGAELALESNYFSQTDALAGRNKGGRFRFGVNYFFGRPNR